MSTINLNNALDAQLSGAANTAAAAAPAGGSNAFAELESTDFVRILVEELSNQDPFEPNDSAAILEQLSSLRSIESDISLQGQLENLVLQNSIGQAGALIGREVEGLSLENDIVRGTVTSVRVVDGETEVQLDTGESLPLDRVTEIANATPAAAPVTAPAVAVDPVQQALAATAGLTNTAEDDEDSADPALSSDATSAADSLDDADQLLDV